MNQFKFEKERERKIPPKLDLRKSLTFKNCELNQDSERSKNQLALVKGQTERITDNYI